jgi:hypothetical protein
MINLHRFTLRREPILDFPLTIDRYRFFVRRINHGAFDLYSTVWKLPETSYSIRKMEVMENGGLGWNFDRFASLLERFFLAGSWVAFEARLRIQYVISFYQDSNPDPYFPIILISFQRGRVWPCDAFLFALSQLVEGGVDLAVDDGKCL